MLGEDGFQQAMYWQLRYRKPPKPKASPHLTKSLFPLRNISKLTVSGFKRTLFLLIMLAAALNTLSNGADVAGMGNTHPAIFKIFGYFSACILHQSNGLLYSSSRLNIG